MKLIQSPGEVKLTVVCCLHGDEVFGKKIFDYYQDRLDLYQGLQLILANQEAFNKQVRFIDQDLNRCFPGDIHGNLEQRLAAQLLPILSQARFVLDLHTTTSGVKLTPIVANLSQDCRKILNVLSSREIALMQPSISTHTLIGNVTAGVSMEFGETYAQTPEAISTVHLAIDNLLSDHSNQPQPRVVYQISQTISLDLSLPEKAQNFTFIEELGFFPFLLHEKSYTTHQGFAANNVTEVLI